MPPDTQLRQFLESVRAGRADAVRAAELAPGWSPGRHPSFLDYLQACGALRPGFASNGFAPDDHAATATAVLPALPPATATTELAATGGESPTTLPYPPRRAGAAGGPAAGDPARRYEPIRLHKEGGLGQVWLARDTVLGREVALKVVRPDRAARPELVARFVREARVTARLEHPGIVPLYDLVEGGDGPRYAMRFVSGGTLADAVAAHHARLTYGEATPLEFRALLDALVAVCRAVAFAHSRGVLHRDLKGQNVVLGEFGEVFLLDFGLTKLTGRPGDADALAGEGADETADGTIAGTPAYMAPEVAAGAESTTASDVYGLGAMLYAVLTGKAPAEGTTPQEVIEKVRSSDPTPPRDVNPATSRALEAVCRKAMARRPEDRYAGAAELATELQRWLADEPVLALREPWPDRAARWARKHRPAVAAAAMTVLTAVVALALSTGLLWAEQRKTAAQKVVADEQRDRAEANLDAAHRLTIDIIAVTEKVLPPVSGSEGPRLELARASVSAFQRFAEQRPDSPGVRRWGAHLHRVEGNLHRFLGDTAKAERSYGLALATLRGDAGANLLTADALRDSAGLLTLTGKLGPALARLEEARGLLAAARAADPEGVAPRRCGAMIDGDRAAVELAAGRYAAALASADRAIATLRELAAGGAAQGRGNETLLLAAALTCRAGACRESGDSAAALAAADAALVALAALAAPADPAGGHNPDDADYLRATAGHERARILTAGGPPQRRLAEAEYRLAADRLAELSRRHPGVPGYRAGFAKALVALGEARELGGPPAAAAADFESAHRCLDRLARECAEVPEYRADLGRACLGLSRTAAGGPAVADDWGARGLAALRAAQAAAPDNSELTRSLAAASPNR